MMHLRGGKNKKHSPGHRLIGAFLCAAAVFLTACDEPEEIKPIDLPSTPALAMQTSWAVVQSSHLRLREAPNTSSRAVATLWQGYVLEIVSKTSSKEVVEDEENYWYQINFDGLDGWVFGAYLKLFNSKVKAEESARELRR